MIRLYDTMQRRKVDFVPADPRRITMYVCGPTVYGRAHIGNARPAVVFDTLARLIRHQYGADSLVYARNVTDVDDKIIAAADAEGVAPAAIAERFERHYLDDMAALGVAPPTLAPHATAEIPAMVAMIERLIDRGHAYAAEGHVLFSVASDPDYGALSRRDRDAMLAGARVEVAPYKHDPADFILWKPSAPQVIGWDSLWGRGRPGWHIECSAMIRAHLGETIDIHGGGLDLIFPHHENEIAQSRCAHAGAPLARHWVHNGFVDMGEEKMSKSVGNVVGVDQLLAAGHKGEVLRLALLSAHYRSPLPWTDELISQSKARLDRWYRALAIAEAAPAIKMSVGLSGFSEALEDDLNTAKALSIIDSHLRVLDRPDPSGTYEEGQLAYGPGSGVQILAAAIGSARRLGLLQSTSTEWFQGHDIPHRISDKIFLRSEAKAARDFATADRIRAELAAEGILLEDGPQGTTWRRA